jgi:hypothetical protein
VASAEPSAWRQKKNEAVGLGWRGPPQRQPNTQKVSVFGNRDQSPRRRSVAGARGSISPASPSLAGTPHSLRMLCDPAPLMACCAHRIRVGPARQQKGYCCCRVQLKVGRRRARQVSTSTVRSSSLSAPDFQFACCVCVPRLRFSSLLNSDSKDPTYAR